MRMRTPEEITRFVADHDAELRMMWDIFVALHQEGIPSLVIMSACIAEVAQILRHVPPIERLEMLDAIMAQLRKELAVKL